MAPILRWPHEQPVSDAACLRYSLAWSCLVPTASLRLVHCACSSPNSVGCRARASSVSRRTLAADTAPSPEEAAAPAAPRQPGSTPRFADGCLRTSEAPLSSPLARRREASVAMRPSNRVTVPSALSARSAIMRQRHGCRGKPVRKFKFAGSADADDGLLTRRSSDARSPHA